MRNVLVIALQLCFLFGCGKNPISPEEFQKKYETEKVILTLLYTNSAYSLNFIFEIDGKKYEICETAYPGFLENGAKFYALVDKKKPEDHYFIFWDQPIISNGEKVSVYARITKAYRPYYDYYMWVEYSHKNGERNVYINLGADSKYLEVLKKLKKNKTLIKIDYYPFVDDNFKQRYVPYIDYEYLESLIIENQ